METLLKLIFIFYVLQSRVECIKDNIIKEEDNDSPHFRIFNGKNAAAGQFPYQVALKVELQELHSLKYSTFCGGSIISEKKVLSAAHCFTGDKSFWEFIFNVPSWRKLKSAKNIYVVAGSLTNEKIIDTKINKNFSGSDKHDFNTEQWRRVSRVFVPDKQYHVKRDVAVVILKHAYKFDSIYVDSIPLATVRNEYTGLKCLASGYGLISKGIKEDERQQSLSLQWARLTIVPTPQCSSTIAHNTKKYICTKSVLSDVRPGDSGGPLVCFGTGEPKEGPKGILVGIACAIITNKPSIFTRVTDYIDFINK